MTTIRTFCSRSLNLQRLKPQEVSLKNIPQQQYRYLCASDRPDQVHNYLHKDRWQFAKIHQLFHSFGADSTNPSQGQQYNTHLNQSCSVTVHDWGPTAYYLNGVMQPFSRDGQPGDIPLYEEQAARPWYEEKAVQPKFRSVRELLAAFPPKFFFTRPSSCHCRWIDVGGMNGEIVQFLLHVMGTEHRQTFNHIVDLRQRAMALELGI